MYGQKNVTDEDFEKALEQVKSRKKKKIKDKPFKGTSINEENKGEYLDETFEQNLLLGLPVTLNTIEGYEIPVGHYRVVGEKIKNKVYLNFYQSSSLIAKIGATETQNDFEQSSINFVQMIPYDEKKVKIIYGSLDFNAYVFVDIKNNIFE